MVESGGGRAALAAQQVFAKWQRPSSFLLGLFLPTSSASALGENAESSFLG